MTDQIILTNDLTKKYKNSYSVKSLNMSLNQGDIYGFLGPNGAGKTTTIRMLLGLIRPTTGNVEVFGRNFKENRNSILREVGSLVESPSYYEKLTAKENLEIIRRMLGVDKQNIDEVLNIVRLNDVKDKLVKNFSFGMKQRLGIAKALLGQPKLLILDEPTNGLDPSGIQEIRELIKYLAETREMSILVSSHLLNEVDQIATKVGIINKGELIFQDKIEVLRKKSNESIQFKTANPQKAIEVLANENIVAKKVNQESIFLDQTDDKFISSVNKILVTNRVPIYRIEENKKSLEMIFLELTKNGESL